ncbi:hypothetical protein YWY31_31530 [Paenibacillus illinoisensis]|uniref:hypothetical protein n=1 Tax=Paenibacillus illinoisensis TaxID=59845 RepID=UPI0034BF1D08
MWIIPYTITAFQEFKSQFNPDEIQSIPELWVENEELQHWKLVGETISGGKKVVHLLKYVTNPKHKAILFLTYSSGTISERHLTERSVQKVI